MDLALGELELIQILGTRVAVEHLEAAQLDESLGIQDSRLRGGFAQDEPVVVLGDATLLAWVHGTRTRLEGAIAEVTPNVVSDSLGRKRRAVLRGPAEPGFAANGRRQRVEVDL